MTARQVGEAWFDGDELGFGTCWHTRAVVLAPVPPLWPSPSGAELNPLDGASEPVGLGLALGLGLVVGLVVGLGLVVGDGIDDGDGDACCGEGLGDEHGDAAGVAP